jgi:ABC-type transport system involved in multi-copper enzyme maturation permease subunit
MTFLPIVDRELRVAARRHATYSMRLAVALVAIVIGVFVYLAGVKLPKTVTARHIFTGLSAVGLFYGLAAGRRFTADCISEEKREGTLGLLFLTHLKGYDVILGKLAATSLNGFFCLLAIFPVIAVPVLMGGITSGEFWRMVLVLLNTFLFSLAIGVFASVLSWNPRRAMGANFLWLLLIAGGLPACAGIIAYFTPSHIFVQEMLYPCPGFSFYLVEDVNYRAHTQDFWWSAAIIHALTWMLVGLSSSIVMRSWHDQPSEKGKLQWREWWERLVYGTAQRRKSLRKRLLGVNPFYWLASRAWFKPVGVWVALAFVGCWWLYLRIALHFDWFDESFCFATALLLNCLLKLWIAVETGQRLAEDQKIGALELLLSTPLNTRDIVRGQWLSLRRQFLWPLLLVVAIELFLVIAVPNHNLQFDHRIRAFGVAGLVFLALDSVALFWVAMATALVAKSPNQASVSTVLRVLVAPWIAFGMISALMNLWVFTVAGASFGWNFYLTVWVVLSVLADLGFGLPAWWRLRNRFRELALKRVVRT